MPVKSSAVLAFAAIGTRWEIETPAPLGMTLREQILQRVDDFDRPYSRLSRRPATTCTDAVSAGPRRGRRAPSSGGRHGCSSDRLCRRLS
ncbi:hypothetical protein AB0F72_34165 [Actinoplanes sp. NPDC023936]|uniref:hypothetical protein n=1 Tax=Actinoplanes sp. NPDC023936 TaxID=3154910 RepID=UPI0033DBC364